MYRTYPWRFDVKNMPLPSMAVVASAALAMLFASETASAQAWSNEVTRVAQYGCTPGYVIDSESSGEVDGSGHCVRAQSDDVIVGGHEIGRDPSPFIRDEILREQDSNPD
jgi:hypothetical protein